MEELTDNAEEHEDEASKVSEQKLGKLQYKVCELWLLKKWVSTSCLKCYHKNF